MLFTSLKFLVFFTIVFFVYWFVGKKNRTVQNAILLIASYVFYGFADWKMIPLLIVATLIFYWLGIQIAKCNNGKKENILTTIGVVLGLGTLLYFKYFNFFIESFASLFESFGLQTNWHTFKIIMPLGVSYFTFKLISYILEVERKKMEPCTDILSFGIYVSFFPTIIAGPIDRPNKFLPQLSKLREFDYSTAVDGCRQILWGLFKKVVIADQLTTYIDSCWVDISSHSGSTLLLGAILYTIQMYNDFSGYSDMAIGLGKLLNIRIAKNFNYPFFATNIAEFWRRWHISLTGWLTDYVFIPLNIKFRNLGQFGVMLAIVINMVLVGMWHGANWTYAVFGLYQGLLFIPVILSGKMNKKQKLKTKLGMPMPLDVLKMISIFMCYTIGAIMFRAGSIGEGMLYYENIITSSLLSKPFGFAHLTFVLIVMVFIIEWFQRKKENPLTLDNLFFFKYSVVRYILYIVMICAIFLYCGEEQQFIYFQF